MEINKVEIKKVEIFLKDLNHKLDLFLESQAVLGKKLDTRVEELIAKKETL
jgi:hypothetical protein